MSKRKRKLLSTINHTEWELYTQRLSKLIDKLKPCVQIYFHKCDNDDDVVNGDDDDDNSDKDDVDDNYNEHSEDNDSCGNNKLKFIIV